MEVILGDTPVGPDHPVYCIGEVGINHQGDIGLVEKFFQMAVLHEWDCIKFQKRNADLWPETPYFSKTFNSEMTYREHRRRLEFGLDEYNQINEWSIQYRIPWSVSVWDNASVQFMMLGIDGGWDIPFIKIPSACLTDDELLVATRHTHVPIVLSTGMSTIEQIDHAVDILGGNNLILLHCVSTYPADNSELNLKCIPMLMDRYNIPIGYSGHEPGLQGSLFAVAYGACVLERHITYDRTAPGSDHAASLEYEGQRRLVRDAKLHHMMKGTGQKVVYESEIPVMNKLRRV